MVSFQHYNLYDWGHDQSLLVSPEASDAPDDCECSPTVYQWSDWDAADSPSHQTLPSSRPAIAAVISCS